MPALGWKSHLHPLGNNRLPVPVYFRTGLLVSWMGRRSDLAVLQVGVDVLDEGVVGVSDRENQLAERAAPHVALLSLHPELKHTHAHTHHMSRSRGLVHMQNLSQVCTRSEFTV